MVVDSARRRVVAGILTTAVVAGCGGRASKNDPAPNSATRTNHTTSETATATELPTTTPKLNSTPYPAVQEKVAKRTVSGGTGVFSTGEWRTRLPVTRLEADTVAFLRRTDFGSSVVIGFEATVDQLGSSIRLERIERRSDRVDVHFSDVATGVTLNEYGRRVMFVRLPATGDPPAEVVLTRTEELSE